MNEPYEGRELANWLIAHGARRGPDVNGQHVFEVAPGKFVKVPVGGVGTPTAKVVAAALGLRYPEMRAALGHPITSAGKPKRKVAVERRGCSKSEVAAGIKTMRRSLAEVEKATNAGIRDSAFYGRVHKCLSDAARQVELALSEATRTGAK